jgi:hypothetical protein
MQGEEMNRLRIPGSSVALYCILFAYSLMCSGSEMIEMDKFFSETKNQQLFSAAEANGQIKAAKEQLIGACLKAKEEKKVVDCACFKREIDKTTNREFYYESILAYLRYEEKVKALKNNDQAKYAELKESESKSMSLSKRLEDACGKM